MISLGVLRGGGPQGPSRWVDRMSPDWCRILPRKQENTPAEPQRDSKIHPGDPKTNPQNQPKMHPISI